MKCTLYMMLAASGLRALCPAQSYAHDWPVRDQETIDKTIALSGNPMRVAVDNVNGYVHVTGTSGSQVHLVAHETIRAETESDLSQAKSEVKLDITEQPGSVAIRYDAPWRCKDCGHEERRHYEVNYDIELEIPSNAQPDIGAVNGEITVNHLNGDFDVHGVNGGIRMSDIAGAGDVRTVNGAVHVQFSNNPSHACNFKSVNGTLDVRFNPGLSADLLLKTFNGQVYSDFDVTPLPVPAGETERQNGMFVYRSRGRSAARVGAGGPQLSFDTLNGSILLHQGNE